MFVKLCLDTKKGGVQVFLYDNDGRNVSSSTVSVTHVEVRGTLRLDLHSVKAFRSPMLCITAENIEKVVLDGDVLKVCQAHCN